MKHFLLYVVVEILQLVHATSSFYKSGDLKNFSRFLDKHKKQSSGGVLSKDVLKNFVKFAENNIFAGVSLLTKLQAGNLTLAEAAAGYVLKQGVLKNFANFAGKNLC